MQKTRKRRLAPNREKTYWNNPSYLGMNPDSHDWAKLAAYIDGEGSINLTPRMSKKENGSQTFCGKVVVTNTDFRLAKWCSDKFGMKFHGHGNNNRQNPNWKSCIVAQACGYRAAWILRNCLPWFTLKREQAQVVIDHQMTVGENVWKRGPGIKTPNNILEMRLKLKKQLTELNRRGPVQKVQGE